MRYNKPKQARDALTASPCWQRSGNEMIKMVRASLAVLFVFSLWSCRENVVDLQKIADQTESIVVYDIEWLREEKYSEDELKRAFSATIDPEVFKSLVPKAKYKNEWVLWKGSRFAIARTESGNTYPLALSYYGGFFKVIGYDGYFYFEGEARQTWELAFNQNVVQKDFIPKRIERNRRNEVGQP